MNNDYQSIKNIVNTINSYFSLNTLNEDQKKKIDYYLNEYRNAFAFYSKNQDNEIAMQTFQLLSSPIFAIQASELYSSSTLGKYIKSKFADNTKQEEIAGGEDRGYARVKRNSNVHYHENNDVITPEENPERYNGFTNRTLIFIYSFTLFFILIGLAFILK